MQYFVINIVSTLYYITGFKALITVEMKASDFHVCIGCNIFLVCSDVVVKKCVGGTLKTAI